jgi:hypothetical protein
MLLMYTNPLLIPLFTLNVDLQATGVRKIVDRVYNKLQRMM